MQIFTPLLFFFLQLYQNLSNNAYDEWMIYNITSFQQYVSQIMTM